MDPGQPIHGMRTRITFDDEMTVRAIATAMEHTPFGKCQQGNDPIQGVVGARLGPGWRQAIETALGGSRGCTHLRELLFNVATAAYQTVFPWRERERRRAGVPSTAATELPHHAGRCIAWAMGGAAMERHYPRFAHRSPAQPTAAPAESEAGPERSSS